MRFSSHAYLPQRIRSGSTAWGYFTWEPSFGVNNLPEAYVDISEEFDAKYAAIQHHESQKAYMDVFGSKLGEDMRIFNAFRGLQYGCKYAECFSSYKIHGYMADFRLLP